MVENEPYNEPKNDPTHRATEPNQAGNGANRASAHPTPDTRHPTPSCEKEIPRENLPDGVLTRHDLIRIRSLVVPTPAQELALCPLPPKSVP